jgi:hypothetical protein
MAGEFNTLNKVYGSGIQVHIRSTKQEKVLDGRGQADTLKGAIEQAQAELIPKLRVEYDKMKLEEKILKAEAKQAAMDENKGKACFHPRWNNALFLHLKIGVIRLLDMGQLQLFVTAHLEQATIDENANKPKRVIGLDTEGRAITRELPMQHAHYMQLCAGCANDCAVFRTTVINMDIVKPLFLHPHITLAVVDKNADCDAIKPLFMPDTDPAWMVGIEDTQLLGQQAMGLPSGDRPSLELMLSSMLCLEKPLTKFYIHEEEKARNKAYACFDDDVKSLSEEMVVYAALDAVAAKELHMYYLRWLSNRAALLQQKRVSIDMTEI